MQGQYLEQSTMDQIYYKRLSKGNNCANKQGGFMKIALSTKQKNNTSYKIFCYFFDIELNDNRK